jgi:hypothetical protein
MKQQTRALEMMSLLVIVITVLLFILLISFFTGFCKNIHDASSFVARPAAILNGFFLMNFARVKGK